jgi:hypothetical protein
VAPGRHGAVLAGPVGGPLKRPTHGGRRAFGILLGLACIACSDPSPTSMRILAPVLTPVARPPSKPGPRTASGTRTEPSWQERFFEVLPRPCGCYVFSRTSTRGKDR